VASALARLAGPANIPSGTSTVFTGTAGHTYAIGRILIVNNTGSSKTIKVGIGGVTDDLLLSPTLSVPQKGVLALKGLVVLAGAETLQVNASATGMTITVFGLDQTP
jgi:hypothetical protein